MLQPAPLEGTLTCETAAAWKLLLACGSRPAAALAWCRASRPSKACVGAFFFEDGSQELVNNVTTSEEFEIKYNSGRWEVSFPWQLQHLDQDFGSVVEAKKYLSRLHPYAKPKLVTAPKRPPPPMPANYGKRERHDFDDMDDDIPF